MKVAVIGAGTMGNGIAHVFAQHGHDVKLIDKDQAALDRALGTIAKNLERQVGKGVLDAAAKDATLKRLGTATELSAAKTAGLVVEAVFENFEVKKAIFAELDALCGPETILASNTSSISVTKIAACTQRPEKVIGMHFMNPVPVMKLVEVICGQATDPAVLEQIMNMSRELEKVPVAVQDYPGFISNRVLMPMINEAVYCLMEGVADKEAIDTVMKLGMAHPMGPLTLADFIGLDICLDIMNVLYDGFGDSKYRPCPLLRRMVDAGHLGRKSGQGFYKYD
ncbi:MAG TPA: 3-hydroxybutyryl-CoA dehydrogenase [Candidatus Krumholzibacteria bacterium]|nr:3-hydroxybutyryl-CoA dehydrogenase [Candidatus Krumholzibacteria bacterium]HRX50166.1 3-hydroxybutyryl-CoA dehydrogenase [Candidatus Krumholzibacteria bacterium]